METGLEGKPWFYGAGVAVLLTAAVAGGGYYVKFKDMDQQIKRKDGSLRDLEAKIRDGEAAEAKLPQFMEEVERLELELEKLLRILPSRRKTEDLLRRIRNLTEQGDFLLVSFDPGALSQQADFYSRWAINIELEGTYHALALFFDRVSRFSRIINIDNLKINPKRSSLKLNQTIRANFTANTFLSNEPAPGDS